MPSLTPHFARDIQFGSVTDTSTVKSRLYFPEAAIVVGISLSSEDAAAAHATDIATATVTDLGVAGAGTTVVGAITTDTDVADDATHNSQALAANIGAYLGLGTDSTAGYEVAAGSLLKVEFTNDSTATLDGVVVTVFYRPGQN